MRPSSCFILLLVALFSCKSKKEYTTWSHYKGSPESIHYSSLDEIDTTNVTQLQVAWVYHTGDGDTIHNSQIQCNPIIVDSSVYGTTPQMKLFAVDALTGKEKWVFNPFDSLADNKVGFFIMNNCRGVAYWSDGKQDRRIFYTAGSDLYCINALNGQVIHSFADSGKLDLHNDLDRDVADLFVTATSPPIIYKDLVIVGTRVDEGPMAAPGHIRAYDVHTGKRRWIFHTIPHPGEEGYNTWDDPNAYKFIGGANAWSGFSLDEKRGILFAPIGSASYDFYGGKRTGANLFANSLLALDAATGKRKWHFQFVHHDVWDRDLSSPPALVTIRKDGRTIDAAAVTTKTGYIYLFDRETGKPLFDIVEKPVPTVSELKGEKLSSTQPFPVAPKPFVRQSFTEKDFNYLLPDTALQYIKTQCASYKKEHMYDPISLTGTIILPGLDGGGEWGGPTFDPETGILYVNANEMAWVLTAVDISNKPEQQENFEQAGKRLYKNNCMTCHGAERQGTGNNPTLLGIEKKYTIQALHELIQTGRRMMPGFKQLNENEREAITSYILNIQSAKTKTFIDAR
jgi:quinoprotein glucose dehydrogenase